MSKKLSPMFPPHIKPVHLGPYKTGSDGVRCFNYQYWNGRWWGQCSQTPEKASSNQHYRSAFQNNYWRGLAHPPKAKP